MVALATPLVHWHNRLVQQRAATFCAEAEVPANADLPQFVKDKFDAFLEGGILAYGLLRLRCADCGHGEWVAFGCRRPRVLSIPLRLLLTAQPKLLTPGLRAVYRVITPDLLGQFGLKPDEVRSHAVNLMRRFGSAASHSSHA